MNDFKITSEILYQFKIELEYYDPRFCRLREWCEIELGKPSFLKDEGKWYSNSKMIVFRDKDAAMLFKLTWM
jgi:hypothetical protein